MIYYSPLSNLSQLSESATLKLFLFLCISCQGNQSLYVSPNMAMWCLEQWLVPVTFFKRSKSANAAASFKMLQYRAWILVNRAVVWFIIIPQDKFLSSRRSLSSHFLRNYFLCWGCATHLHHSYSRGMGSARRSLNQQSLQPQTEESQACWPTSPAEDVSPRPHPQVGYQDFSLGMASECPCGSPSDIEASLFVPCCRTEQIKEQKCNTWLTMDGLGWHGEN